MAWPSSTWVWGNQLLPKIQKDVALAARTIARFTPVTMCATSSRAAGEARKVCGSKVRVIGSIPVNDCWMRDTGPVFRVDGAGGKDAIGLNFNGWGWRQIHGKDEDIAKTVAAYLGLGFTKASVVGEGGGVESDGDGTLIATESCWVNVNRNPGKSKAQIEAALLAAYGADKIIWFPGLRNEDITDDHIDGTARFVRPGVVMCQLPPSYRTDVWAEDAREIHQILLTSTDAKGRQVQVLTVEGPDTTRWSNANFLDSYVNWVIAKGAVITAEFGDASKDEAAKAAIEAAFPGKVCVQLNLDRLHGYGGGGIHCITQQEPKG